MAEAKGNAVIPVQDEPDDTEISLDEIEKGLFLGNATAARHLNTLKERNISYILTLDTVPLPEHVLQNSHLTTKYIKISDMPKEDLIHVLDECMKFITAALENQRNILVHCYFGVSRSAAVVIAYIMQKYKINYSCAFERVKSKRRFIGPNHGFVLQLKLYKKMNYRIEPENPFYKSYRLRLASSQVRKAKILPQTCMDVIKSDPGLTQENPEPIVYRCRKCRRIVASKSNLLHHRELSNCIKKFDENPEGIKANVAETLIDQIAEKIQGCTTADSGIVYCKSMVFVEPMTWMKDILTQTNGKLNCPKCTNKIGHFNWISSSVCPCGAQICPAFYLVPSKVELSRVVQNLQTTV